MHLGVIAEGSVETSGLMRGGFLSARQYGRVHASSMVAGGLPFLPMNGSQSDLNLVLMHSCAGQATMFYTERSFHGIHIVQDCIRVTSCYGLLSLEL
ncbi:hypothetical protein SeMB42_g01998 [Synchytrium endobioticum]|uniref:Uncharacterized protein n=1 Tax=Synchytrium endobioticum TaxID=286115 RepID=A0A507DI65_9FUNG|nr:hypothetical protein SeMB42_g01998 [Synchytrium endobioticum]